MPAESKKNSETSKDKTKGLKKPIEDDLVKKIKFINIL